MLQTEASDINSVNNKLHNRIRIKQKQCIGTDTCEKLLLRLYRIKKSSVRLQRLSQFVMEKAHEVSVVVDEVIQEEDFPDKTHIPNDLPAMETVDEIVLISEDEDIQNVADEVSDMEDVVVSIADDEEIKKEQCTGENSNEEFLLRLYHIKPSTVRLERLERITKRKSSEEEGITKRRSSEEEEEEERITKRRSSEEEEEERITKRKSSEEEEERITKRRSSEEEGITKRRSSDEEEEGITKRRSSEEEEELEGITKRRNSEDLEVCDINVKRIREDNDSNHIYQCGTCDKSFAENHLLERHNRSHLKVKPFKCSVCGRSFAIQSYLTIHFRTHTGERPYSCNVCGKSYTAKSSLTHHIRAQAHETASDYNLSGHISQDSSSNNQNYSTSEQSFCNDFEKSYTDLIVNNCSVTSDSRLLSYNFYDKLNAESKEDQHVLYNGFEKSYSNNLDLVVGNSEHRNDNSSVRVCVEYTLDISQF